MKRSLFRVGAVCLGLTPLLLAELACWLGGWGEPDWRNDPFVGFHGTRPLFVLNSEQDLYHVAENRYACFQPETFAAQKGDDEFRIFCLGGSTVQGRPFSIETSFTTWLELSLKSAAPARSWEVVNCGGISYASYRLVPILEEVFAYQPDLIILYLGHNEFLEDRTYQDVKQRSPQLQRLLAGASQLRSWNALRQTYLQLAGINPPQQTHVRPVLPEDVQTLLDFEGGLQQFQRDQAWQQGVAEHFRYNLRRMVERCRQENVVCWLVDPTYNLCNSPPFKSQPSAAVKTADRQRWLALRQEAAACYQSDLPRAAQALEQAVQIDGMHAGLFYDLGKCYETMGQFEQAYQHYLQAKDLDVCPLRITEPLRQTIRDVAQQANVPLIPVHANFRRRSRHGIPGDRLLADHVHPSLSGHQLVAELMLQQCVAAGWVDLPSDWLMRRDAVFQAHLATLPDAYYAQGHQRLENLKAWTQGRAPVWAVDGTRYTRELDSTSE